MIIVITLTITHTHTNTRATSSNDNDKPLAIYVSEQLAALVAEEARAIHLFCGTGK